MDDDKIADPATGGEEGEPDERPADAVESMPTDDAVMPASESRRDPSEMSVDHLTQAFASLLGEPTHDNDVDGADDTLLDDASPSESAANANDPNGDLTSDDDERGKVRRRSDRRSRRGTATSDGDLFDDDESPASPLAIVEAILFVGHPENEVITARLIASYLRGVSPQEVDQLVQQLNEGYDEEESPYAIVSEGKGYRMSLRPEFARVRDMFYGRVREAKLSQSAIDLLALIAYRQPITREQLDKLRGQPSGGVLSQLVRRQLLCVEYTETKPRKKQYRTTDRFLELFGLESLEDLPHHDEA